MDESDLEYVGFWARVGASLIDTVILLVISVPLLVWIYGWAYYTDPERGFIAGPADLMISWVLPAVATVLFWLYKTATPGKMAISARVVDATTGQPMRAGQATIRYLGYFVSLLPLFFGFIWIGLDPRKQGWHDKIAGTVVVRPRHRGPAPVKFGGE
ncbi:MAG: RDD family protein [Solimonas sp.]